MPSPGTTPQEGQQPTQAPPAPLFSPLFGPYSAPPEVPAELGRQQFRRSTGRAQPPDGQTERLLLAPSLFIGGAWTDNVFLTSTDKQSDFFTELSPGLQLSFRGAPDYGLAVGYVFTSEIYVEHPELDTAQANQAATFAAFYKIAPTLRFDFHAGYLADNNTTGSGIAGISTGRTASQGGFATGDLSWSFDPQTTFQFLGSWYAQSFGSTTSNVSVNSYDTYSFTANVSRRVTPILSGQASYQFLRSNVSNGDNAEYHLIQLGGGYQLTQSLSVGVAAGPQIVTIGDQGVSLATQIGATQLLSNWGSAGLSYTRSQQPTGGLGGTAETNSFSVFFGATNVLVRDLTVGASAVFTTADSGNSRINANSLGGGAVATYPITPWMLAVLAYTYFRQGSSGSALSSFDVNQVTLGVELFYPLRLY